MTNKRQPYATLHKKLRDRHCQNFTVSLIKQTGCSRRKERKLWDGAALANDDDTGAQLITPDDKLTITEERCPFYLRTTSRFSFHLNNMRAHGEEAKRRECNAMQPGTAPDIKQGNAVFLFIKELEVKRKLNPK